jgi:hypothetical protein
MGGEMITGAFWNGYNEVSEGVFYGKVRFTHDVGPDTEEAFRLSGTTGPEILAGLQQLLADRKGKKDIEPILQGIAIGTAIPRTPVAPPAPPAPTPKQSWQALVRSVAVLSECALPAGAALNALNTAKAKVNTDYQAGFADGL